MNNKHYLVRKFKIKMRAVLVVSSMILFVPMLKAQNVDHLHPCEDFLVMDKATFEKFSKIRNLLRKSIPEPEIREMKGGASDIVKEGASDIVQVRLTYTVPAGTGHGFALVRTMKFSGDDIFNGEYKFDSYRIVAAQIGNKESISKEVPEEFGRLIEQVWTHFAGEIRTSPEYIVGAGGQYYYFGCNTGKFSAVMGTTFSPVDDSLLSLLVNVAENIFMLANGKQTIDHVESLLIDLSKEQTE